jgi:uncharacterized protein
VGGYRRLWHAGRLIARAAAALLIVALASAIAAADEPAGRQTIVVFGDSQAQGLAVGLQRVLLEDAHYRVLNRSHPGAALVHDSREWLRPVERFTAHEKADIAVVMFGANDRLDMREEDGDYLHFRTQAWRQAYAARADEILKLLADAKLKIVWCGNPIARSPVYSADMKYINDIYAGEAAKFGAKFLSLWDAVADDEGRFTAYGKDREGTTERLRTDDGIHFTEPGYELIAEKIVGILSTAAAPAPRPEKAAAPGGAEPAAAAAGESD